MLAALVLAGSAQASGFSVGTLPPGVSAEAVSRSEDGSAFADAVRVTLPFTVRGRLYLLRLLGADGEILWIGQREGGGRLVFDVSVEPLPDNPANGPANGPTDFELILTTDAPGTGPLTIPLSYAPERPDGADGESEAPGDGLCPRDTTCPLARFRDLDPGAWYHDGIHAMLERGIMNGFDDGTFRPQGETSRAMLVTMLWRQAGEPSVRFDTRFSDVPKDAWYADAVRWAASSGIVGGYDAETFAPADPVTREQLAAILYRLSGLGVGGTADGPSDSGTGSRTLAAFGDAESVSPWARDAVRWAVSRGVLNGRGGMLCPDQPALRAEVAAVLARYSEAGR